MSADRRSDAIESSHVVDSEPGSAATVHPRRRRQLRIQNTLVGLAVLAAAALANGHYRYVEKAAEIRNGRYQGLPSPRSDVSVRMAGFPATVYRSIAIQADANAVIPRQAYSLDGRPPMKVPLPRSGGQLASDDSAGASRSSESAAGKANPGTPRAIVGSIGNLGMTRRFAGPAGAPTASINETLDALRGPGGDSAGKDLEAGVDPAENDPAGNDAGGVATGNSNARRGVFDTDANTASASNGIAGAGSAQFDAEPYDEQVIEHTLRRDLWFSSIVINVVFWMAIGSIAWGLLRLYRLPRRRRWIADTALAMSIVTVPVAYAGWHALRLDKQQRLLNGVDRTGGYATAALVPEWLADQIPQRWAKLIAQPRRVVLMRPKADQLDDFLALPMLESVTLFDSKPTSISDELRGGGNLLSLTVYGSVQPQWWHFVKRQDQLLSLALVSTDLNDAAYDTIRELPNLRNLRIGRTDFDAPRLLGGSPNLQNPTNGADDASSVGINDVALTRSNATGGRRYPPPRWQRSLKYLIIPVPAKSSPQYDLSGWPELRTVRFQYRDASAGTPASSNGTAANSDGTAANSDGTAASSDGTSGGAVASSDPSRSDRNRDDEHVAGVRLRDVPSLQRVIIDGRLKVRLEAENAPQLTDITRSVPDLMRNSFVVDGVDAEPYRALRLVNCPSVESLVLSIHGLDSIEHLDIRNAGNLRDIVAGSFRVENFGSIGRVDCDYATAQALLNELAHVRGLRKLRLIALPLQQCDLSVFGGDQVAPTLNQLTVTASSLESEQVRHLASLVNLEHLDLEHTAIDNETFDWIVQTFPRLENLRADMRDLKHMVLRDNGRLRFLHTPPLREASVVDIADVDRLESSLHLDRPLERLNISGAKRLVGLAIGHPLPDDTHLGEFRDLRYFVVGGPNVDDSVYDCLRRCDRLEHLMVGYGSLSDRSLRDIGRMSRLRGLALPGADVDDSVALAWRQMRDLWSVDLSDTQVDFETVSWLRSNLSLRYLALDRVDLSDDAIAALATIGQLLSLSIRQVELSPNDFAELCRNGVEHINVSGCPLTAAHMEQFPEHSTLKILTAIDCGLEQTEIRQLLSSNPNLKIDVGETLRHGLKTVLTQDQLDRVVTHTTVYSIQDLNNRDRYLDALSMAEGRERFDPSRLQTAASPPEADQQRGNADESSTASDDPADNQHEVSRIAMRSDMDAIAGVGPPDTQDCEDSEQTDADDSDIAESLWLALIDSWRNRNSFVSVETGWSDQSTFSGQSNVSTLQGITGRTRTFRVSQ